MKLSQLIASQAEDIAVMWACGMTVMLLHGLLARYQDKRKPAAAILFIQDILFWVLAALLASAFLYYCAFGQITFHSMAALCAGAAFWKACFARPAPSKKK